MKEDTIEKEGTRMATKEEMQEVITEKQMTDLEKQIEEAKKNYSVMVHHAGQIQYEIDCLEGELAATNIKIRNINTEYSKLTKKEKQNETVN